MSPSAAPPASADSVAGALLRALSGCIPYAEAAPIVWAYVHAVPPPYPPPPILDALARLAASDCKNVAEAAEAMDAAAAFVSLSSLSARAWAQAVRSSTFAHIQAIRDCLVDTLLPAAPAAGAADVGTLGAATPTAIATRERLSALSAEPAATALYATWRARTPLDIAVAAVTTAPTSLDACERLCAALEHLPSPCWRYVCDDDFARVAAVLRSRATCEIAIDALACEAFATRVSSGFGRATQAAGFLYGALMGMVGVGEDVGGRAEDRVAELVTGWPSLFGEDPSFRLGYLSWCAEYGRGPRPDISEIATIVAYVRPGIMSPREMADAATEAGWFGYGAHGSDEQGPFPEDPTKRKLIAAAYAVAPAYFEKRLASREHTLQSEVLELPLAVHSAIDAEADALLAALLSEIPGLRDNLCAMGSNPVECSFLTTAQARVASSTARQDACSLRLQRVPLRDRLSPTLCAYWRFDSRVGGPYLMEEQPVLN